MTDKRTALITGASAGLGKELARLFAKDGHDVVLVARSAAKLEELATELRGAHGVQAHVLVADLSLPAGAEQVWAGAESHAVDYLVNNAGFGTNGAFVDLDLARELEMVQVTVA